MQITTVACDGYSMNFACPSGHQVVVVYANFGRLDTTTCGINSPEGQYFQLTQIQVANTNCVFNALSLFQNFCGHDTCTFTPSYTLFGTDPCYGIYKYLKVIYKCHFQIGS